jgi:hypothetical protein
MKKITLCLALMGLLVLQSCTINEVNGQNDNDTISEVFEYQNVDLMATNGYRQVLTFPHAIYASDMVLVYRLASTGPAGDVWKLVPETYYFNNGTLDFGYRNDFTRYDAEVSLFGFDLLGLNTSFKLDQIFRVVIIPGYFGNKNVADIDFSSYLVVQNYFHLNKQKKTIIHL